MQLRIGAMAIITTMIVGLGVAGCGNSGGSTSPSTTALTKAEFLAKANAICKAGNKLTQAAASKAFPNQNAKPTQAQVASYEKVVAPEIQSQIDGVRALGAPAGDEATVTGMLNTAQQDLNKVKSNPDLTVSGDTFANFAKVAHPYGLTSCAPNSGK